MVALYLLTPGLDLCVALASKGSKKRVKWADHFGGDLSVSYVMEGDESLVGSSKGQSESSLSWSDRKKRDRLREKELLLSVKYVFKYPSCGDLLLFCP
jgi:hypothetical protein